MLGHWPDFLTLMEKIIMIALMECQFPEELQVVATTNLLKQALKVGIRFVTVFQLEPIPHNSFGSTNVTKGLENVRHHGFGKGDRHVSCGRDVTKGPEDVYHIGIVGARCIVVLAIFGTTGNADLLDGFDFLWRTTLEFQNTPKRSCSSSADINSKIWG